MSELVRGLRAKLARGGAVGPFCKTCDPAFIEVLGRAGFDFAIIDLEHGPNSVQTAQELIRAAELAGLAPVVRVKENNTAIIGEVLDIGAAGVQVPQVNDAGRAREVVRAAKFAPLGQRGVCRFVRAAGYSSQDRFRYFREANETLVIVHIEGQEGLAGLAGVLGVEGIDVVFIGPYDLSQSLGVPGQVEHEKVTAGMRAIIAECARKGIAVGTFVETVEGAGKWRSLGVSYLAYSVDVGLFYEKCRELVGELTGGASAPREEDKP
jgi:4-hydroxy-2-oxoheptanedioate aldolase